VRGTGTVFAVFLALFVPQHKLGAIEIVQFDAGTVPVQQELTELNVLMDDDTVGVSVQVGHRLGHVQCRTQLVAW
jgi:cellulose synthase/poly-beta-1,6-N-acetylglucosamine synthase-like glycosyltransferase